MDINELYQELIIDHGTQPRNFRMMAAPTLANEGYNPLCGDKIYLQLSVENNCIQDACFQGQGCAISMASASLMTELLVGKTLNEASMLFETVQQHLMGNQVCGNHHSTVSSKLTSSSVLSDAIQNDSPPLGKLAALTGIRAFPARVKCATLAWHTLQAAINEPI